MKSCQEFNTWVYLNIGSLYLLIYFQINIRKLSTFYKAKNSYPSSLTAISINTTFARSWLKDFNKKYFIFRIYFTSQPVKWKRSKWLIDLFWVTYKMFFNLSLAFSYLNRLNQSSTLERLQPTKKLNQERMELG